MTAASLFRPRKQLPRLTAASAHAARIFSARRSLLWIGAVELHIGPAPDLIPDAETIWLRIDDEVARAVVDRKIVTDLLTALDPAAANVAPPWRALLLELALADILARLRATCPRLAVEILTDAPATCPDLATTALGIYVGESAMRVELAPRVAAQAAAALASIVPERRPLPALSATLHVRRCIAELTLSELQSLQIGDVVLADALPDADVLLVAGERLAWRASRAGTHVTVTAARNQAGDTFEGWTMHDDPALAAPDASLGELPVRLAFELGKLDLSLAELQSVGPGYVFELARADDEAIDIVTNGRRIGRGRIVDVGGALGVQVVRLGRNE